MRGTRVFSLLAFFLFCANAALAQLPARNPLNANIPKTAWSMELQDVLTIPNFDPNDPHRLEFLTSGGAANQAYVIDQRGQIYSFDVTSGSPTANLFLDVSSIVPAFRSSSTDGGTVGQQGIRGLAFHPDFNNVGTDGYRKFYTSHSRTAFGGPLVGDPVIYGSPGSPNHDSMVGEWMVDANGDVDPNSYREILLVGQPRADHNIAQIGFNPNANAGDADYGNLYIALGDGGGADDPQDLAQNTSQPHGSLLRIDPLESGSDPFSIPADNPLRVNNNLNDSRNLIWAYGLRNAHRFSFDTGGDGTMLISDIGQGNIEEINIGVAGGNYGWVEREGTFETTGVNNVVDTLPTGHASDSFLYPVAQYDHNNNILSTSGGSVAIVGGSVYRGSAVPQLTGMYLFGDFGSNPGPIFAVDVDDLVERDDFTNLDDFNDGLLAPFAEVQLTDGGVEKTLVEIISDELGSPQGRSDLRFGVGPDQEIYVLNKRDGVVRKIVSVSGLLDGDANRDGMVDAADFLTWQRNAGSGGDWSDGDFNGDGLVGSADLALLEAEYGNSSFAVSAATTVPEPGTALAGLVGAALVILPHRRRS